MKYIYTTTEKLMLTEAVKRAVPLLKKGRERTLILGREVKVNGARVSGDIRLEAGSAIEVFAPSAYLESRDVRIIYGDEDIVVADKPIKTESETELPLLLEERCGKLIPVHRLDTNTAGIMVLAKNVGAADALKAAFKESGVKKTYIATVCGMPKKPRGVIKNRLKKDANTGKVASYPLNSKTGAEAETVYEVLTGGDGLCKVKLEPKTGRTHQLRAHMAEIGCPILGDGKYGNFAENKRRGATHQELRAVRLEFVCLPAPLERLNGKIFTTEDYYENEKEKEG